MNGFFLIAIIYDILLAIAVAASVIALYALGYWVYRNFTGAQTHQFLNRKKAVILLVVIVICNIIFFSQFAYIQLAQLNPVDYPCQRIFCLDNHFPETSKKSNVDTSNINFDIYIAHPSGFTLRFVDTTDPHSFISSQIQSQPLVSLEYLQGETSIDVAETRYTPSVQTALQQSFGAPAVTPGGHQVYISGNTLSATVMGNTAIFSDDTNNSETLTPDLAKFFDSFQKTPLNKIVFMPYGTSKQ